MAKIILKLNDDVIDKIQLKQGDLTIGRRPGCDILIDNLLVSHNHANIFTVGEDSFIQDLNSTNGTFINNKKVTKHHLKNSDVVVIGKYSLTYVKEAGENVAASGSSKPAFKSNHSATPLAAMVAKSESVRPGPIGPELTGAESIASEYTSSQGNATASPEKETATPATIRHGAIFILSGTNSGKRIDLKKSVTNLGKTGKPAGIITRRGDSYLLAPAQTDEKPKLNGKVVSTAGVELRNGDIIEVGDSRLQFYLK